MSISCKKIEPVTEIDKLLYKTCTGEFKEGFVEVGDEKVVMPMYYEDIANGIENFKVRDTDVWVISYPKTGTTWLQEMVWMILNNIDFVGATEDLDSRYTFLERQCMFDSEAVLKKYPEIKLPLPATKSVEVAKNDKRKPRLIKTHMPWCLLPKTIREENTEAKIVCVVRNPKDTCVSFYHHYRIIDAFDGTLDDFCELFLAGKTYYGSYWHILDLWERRYDPNLLLVKYEDMKKDLTSVIRKVSDFLIGRQLSENQVSALRGHLSFESMKKNPSCNFEEGLKIHQKYMNIVGKNEKFIRNGEVGGHKDEMSSEMQRRFDQWIEEHTKDINITF